MVLYTNNVVGLPGGPLITSFPIYQNIVPDWMTNNNPGILARTPRRSVQHGNANPNSTAAGEARYLRNGAEGRQASWHFSADDREVWQSIQVDRVTWQGADGDGPGNMCGVSTEMIESDAVWGNPARRDRCIEVNAELMGRIAARLNIAKPERHWDFNYNNAPSERHHCPHKLMTTYINGRLAWDIYVELWYKFKADEVARMNGGKVVDATPKPGKDTPVADKNLFEGIDGLDNAIAKRLFGSVKGDDGYVYAFDPVGTVSDAWIAFAREYKMFPRLREVWVYKDKANIRKYFVFEGGLVIYYTSASGKAKAL